MAWQLCEVFEVVRCALFDKIDYNYEQNERVRYAWPVIDLHLRYTARRRVLVKNSNFVQRLWGENCLVIDYLISDADSGKRLIRASTT